MYLGSSHHFRPSWLAIFYTRETTIRLSHLLRLHMKRWPKRFPLGDNDVTIQPGSQSFMLPTSSSSSYRSVSRLSMLKEERADDVSDVVGGCMPSGYSKDKRRAPTNTACGFDGTGPFSALFNIWYNNRGLYPATIWDGVPLLQLAVSCIPWMNHTGSGMIHSGLAAARSGKP